MATIKTYTSLEQSMKLAEILPLESADNIIVSFGDRYGVKTVVMPKETLDVIRTPFDDIRETTMCWSLAALLDVIPNYKLSSEHNYHTCTAVTSFGKETVGWYDNPVDACYELILKLNELNLL